MYYFLRTLQGANSPFVRLTYEALVDFLIASGTSVTVRNRYGEYVPQNALMPSTQQFSA